MKLDKISDGKGGNYISITSPDVEKINPVKFFREWHITKETKIFQLLLKSHGFSNNSSFFNETIYKNAEENWNLYHQKIKSTRIPNNLKQIFNARKKKDQVKLLKGLSINSDILIAFLFYAWEEHGYSFSQYKSKHQRRGLDKKELPDFVYIENDKVEVIGSSNLSTGQLKQALQQRTVVVSKFIDKGDDWHCLFVTYNSLRGEENWRNGQPHFHYISSKFGISREKVVESLKQRYYKLGSLPHIILSEY